MTRYQNDKTLKIDILEFYILSSAATFRILTFQAMTMIVD